ncbi:hypothetical protein Cgig2_024240 [Carnegiea gigantea]|uniref:Uncharacterized protein n=1 Tax=Carnegiea gigantea TaxID=171969 RepID=A0A9Q1JZZ3_9CARY|nr:hypothetical protein Cgig2_024240 [Carnegiea gigantea]
MSDQCTSFFFARAKQRRSQLQIYRLQDEGGIVREGREAVANIMVSFYEKLLGGQSLTRTKSSNLVFQEGPLIPITIARMTKLDYQQLMDKITAKIRGIFILPKMAVQKIEAMSKNFLWGAQDTYAKVPLLKWTEVCTPKKEDGLGLKNLTA